MKPEPRGGANIPHNSLEDGEVWLPRVMHEQADLLNGVDDVRARQGEVPESTCQTSIERQIGGRQPVGYRELGTCIDGRVYGLAVAHVSVLDDLKSVLVLGVKEPMLVVSDVNHHKVMGRTEINMENSWWSCMMMCRSMAEVLLSR